MNTSRKLASLQQWQFQKYSQSSTPHTFFNLLTSPELLSTVEDLLPAHRERSFPPTETLSMFLAQAMGTDNSCQNIVDEAALTRAISGLPPCSSNTGSYCKAHQRLPLSMVSGLVRQTGMQMTAQVPRHWRWSGAPHSTDRRNNRGASGHRIKSTSLSADPRRLGRTSLVNNLIGYLQHWRYCAGGRLFWYVFSVG